MISTATAAVNAADTSPVATSQPTSVRSAVASTIGTNTEATRSASRWIGAFPDCASATSRAICASAVSDPTLVARTTMRPETVTVPPATSAPGTASIGTGSPVSIDWSTDATPSTTTPSVATLSPGRTTKRSPTATASTGTSTSTPPRSTRASCAPSSSSERIASLERLRARSSSQRPSRISVVITAATSKYVWASIPPTSTTTDQAHAAIVPTEIRVSIVAARCRAFNTVARWNPAPHQKTTGVASARASHSQPPNRSGATIVSSTSGAVSTVETTSLDRTARVVSAGSARSPGSAAWYPVASTVAIRSSTEIAFGSNQTAASSVA